MLNLALLVVVVRDLLTVRVAPAAWLLASLRRKSQLARKDGKTLLRQSEGESG